MHSHRRYTGSRSHSHRRQSPRRSYTPEYRQWRIQSPIAEGILAAGQTQILTLAWEYLASVCIQQREIFVKLFSQYGLLSGVNVVYDQRTGRSYGFALVYFERIDDSKEAMERANGMELDGRRILVDYSIIKRAHTPTPGIYMGRPTHSSGGGGGGVSGGSCGGDGGRRQDSYYDRGYDTMTDVKIMITGTKEGRPLLSLFRSRSRSRSYSPRCNWYWSDCAQGLCFFFFLILDFQASMLPSPLKKQNKTKVVYLIYAWPVALLFPPFVIL